MLEAPDELYGQGIGSSYQQQEETLSKHFLRRPECPNPIEIGAEPDTRCSFRRQFPVGGTGAR